MFATIVTKEQRMNRKALFRDISILAAFMVVTVLALSQIPRISVDGSIDAFVPSNHPIMGINDEIESTFGSLDSIVVAVSLSFGSVLEPDVMSLVEEMTSELEAIPLVESVTSLANVDYVTSSADEMVVVPLVESTDAGGARVTSRRITEWQEAYVGTVVSSDLKTTAIIVQPRADATPHDLSDIYETARRLATERSSANVHIRIAGAQVYEEEIARSVGADVRYLIPVAAALIILVLALSFRRFLGVALPVLSIAVAGVWVVGVIGVTGITLTMATLLVPVLLLVVGSAYGIHVMQHFYEDVAEQGGFVSYEKLAQIIRVGTGAIRKPILLAGITTAAGFAAQLSSPLGPFRVFGVLSAVGVGAALLTSLVLIPALLRLRYRRGLDADVFRKPDRTDLPNRPRRLTVVLKWTITHGKNGVLLVSLALVAATVLMIPSIRVGTNIANFFKPSSQVAEDARAINADLGGTGIISVQIDAPQPGDILQPDFLSDLEEFGTYLADKYPAVTGVRSVVPSIKRINSILNHDSVPYEVKESPEPTFDFFGDNGFFSDGGSDGGAFAATTSAPDVAEGARTTDPSAFVAGVPADSTDRPLTYEDIAAMLESAALDAGVDADMHAVIQEFLAQGNVNGAAFNEIPSDPAKYGLATNEDLKDLVAQYLVLYSGNLDMFINDALEPDRTLVTVQVNDESRDLLVALRKDITAFWDGHLGAGWRATIGGPSTLVLVLSELVTRSQYLSLVGALVIVWAIVAITFRSPLAGLFGLIPVVFALIGVFLSMATFGFYLDVVTSLLAALAIGIGVDYGIHLMSAYRRALYSGHQHPLDVVYRTTGSAIVFNATSVAVGFLSLLASQFVPIRQVGILFSVSMVFAGAASLIVLPIALELFSPRFITRGIPHLPHDSDTRRQYETTRSIDDPSSAAGPSGARRDGTGDHAAGLGEPTSR